MSSKLARAFRSGAPAPRAPAAPPADAAGGGPAALSFPDLYAQQVRFVWRSLRLLGVPAEGLEDAVQDTFAVIARQLDSFEGRSALSTWIFAIVQRVAANHRRTQRRKLAALRPLTGNLPGHEPTPHATAEASEAACAIERFVESLSDERRRLFILALLEGIPAPEIAAAEGVPLNTLYSRIRLLRRELRLFLHPSSPGETANE